MPFHQDVSILMIGERTNVNGSSSPSTPFSKWPRTRALTRSYVQNDLAEVYEGEVKTHATRSRVCG
jgi:hypothetical protein